MLFSKWLRLRKIKEVDSWDGSASNYSSPGAYARASLINFNPVAGNTDEASWTKDLIKLPVRDEGDSSDTYIRQAVQAAAGGRGITRVKKPANVSTEDFNRLMKAAANEIIKAYGQWDGIAPDSIYKIAGKEKPVERAVAFNQIFNDVFDLVRLADEAEETITALYDIYMEDSTGRFFALGARDGVLYRISLDLTETGILLGEFVPVQNQGIIEKRVTQKFRAYLGPDDSLRWLSIASVAVLNRIGEIDSTELFDSFLDAANRTGYFPELTVYHLGKRSVIGKADILARVGYVYIAGGTFNDNKFGRAAYKNLQKRNDWGNSIEFYSPEADIELFEIDGIMVQIPVYKKGINTDITLVREKDAASVLTLHKVKGDGQ